MTIVSIILMCSLSLLVLLFIALKIFDKVKKTKQLNFLLSKYKEKYGEINLK